MITGPLPPGPRALIEQVAELLAVDRFLIFGGIALDMLADADADADDIDIAIDARDYRVEPMIAGY